MVKLIIRPGGESSAVDADTGRTIAASKDRGETRRKALAAGYEVKGVIYVLATERHPVRGGKK